MRAVLTYHSIDDSASPISVAPASFAAHVRWLASGAVRVLSLEGLVAESSSGDDALGDAVALTFDDGFENVARYAAPLLADHGLPATIFVVSGHVGRTNAWGGHDQAGIPTLPLMGWDSLGRLADQGVSLGAHTRTHPALDSVDAGMLAAEIDGSAQDIGRRLGRIPSVFAYPYGLAPPAAVEHVRRNFAVGVTTEMGFLHGSADCARIPRLDGYYLRRPDSLATWGTARFRAYLKLRATVRVAREQVRRGARRFGAA